MHDDETEVISDFELKDLPHQLGMEIGLLSVKKYFIKYIIHSISPEGTNVVLFFHDSTTLPDPYKGMNYCSKVNVGESLEKIMYEEIESITGKDEYVLQTISQDGTDTDTKGNTLDRYRLVVEVPYFNTEKKRFSGLRNAYMSWVNSEDLLLP